MTVQQDRKEVLLNPQPTTQDFSHFSHRYTSAMSLFADGG